MRKSEQAGPNKSVRALRGVIGKTQSQFAATIGVSVETIRSWELGRNRLKPAAAQRIRMATGADIGSLMRGDGVVTESLGRPYTKADFENWKAHYGVTNEERAKEWVGGVIESVRLLYTAAGKQGNRARDRLPALHMSMLEWLQQNYRDFQLQPQVSVILKTRKSKSALTMTYGQWRSEWAGGWRDFYQFKEDQTKLDGEILTLEVECWPEWSPGGNMTVQKPDHLDMVPGKLRRKAN